MKLLEYLGRRYCLLFHNQISRPIHGKYTCLVCQREYRVEWVSITGVEKA